jgi:hypothetical protein
MMHEFHVDAVLQRLTLYQTPHVPMHNRHPPEAKTSTPAREVNSSHEDMSKGNHSPVVVSPTHATWNPAREASLQTVLMQLEPVWPAGRVASRPCGHMCGQPCGHLCGHWSAMWPALRPASRVASCATSRAVSRVASHLTSCVASIATSSVASHVTSSATSRAFSPVGSRVTSRTHPGNRSAMDPMTIA